MKKSTKELAREYASKYTDVSYLTTAKNGHYASFREAGPTGGRTFRLSRKHLLETDVAETPFGAIEIN